MNITLSLEKFKGMLVQAYDEGFDDGASEHQPIYYNYDKERDEFLESIVKEAIDVNLKG